LVGLCPFHQEKDPSFGVDPERQMFYCFGCQKGGTVFNFLMEMEGLSFVDAVRELGRKCGVEVEYRKYSEAERSQNEVRYEANGFAARFYHQQLKDGRTGKRAQEYLRERGIPEEAWKSFSLGFAPDSWDRLWSASRSKGVKKEVLAELRLITKSEKSTGYYDYFRNRIMFPILSVSRRVVAFGARALGQGVEPKYLNSAESPIFSKRRTFYGIDLARDAIRERREAIVVEGYTDLIALHLLGLTQAVAACGTALTPDHASALRRLTQKVTLVPDADLAGEKAAVSAGAVLLSAGLEVRVVRLQPDSDPDAAARELGSEKFAQLIDQSMDYFSYLNYTIKDRQLSLREQESLIRQVVSGIAHLQDKFRYDMIIKELARTLAVNPASLRAMHTGGPASSSGARSATGVAPGGSRRRGESGKAASPARVAVEKLALRFVMEGTQVALEAIDSLDEDDFSDPGCRKIYKILDLARESHIDIRSRELQRRAEEAGLEGLAAEIALVSLPPGNVATLLKDTIRRIKELKIHDELTVLRKKLQELPSESEEAVAVAEYYYKLKQALVEL
jgi:DNA primase